MWQLPRKLSLFLTIIFIIYYSASCWIHLLVEANDMTNSFPASEGLLSMSQKHLQLVVQQKRVKRGGNDGNNNDAKKKQKLAQTNAHTHVVDIKQALTGRNFNDSLIIAVRAIPKDLVAKFKEITEENIVTRPDFLLKAICMYINLLRMKINGWKNRQTQTEATQLIKQFNGQIQLFLTLLGKKQTDMPSICLHLPTKLISSSAELAIRQSAKETVYNVKAAKDSFCKSKLADYDYSMLSAPALEDLNQRILENAYLDLLQTMLGVNFKSQHQWKKLTIVSAYEEMSRLKQLMSLVDVEKKRFADIFQQYDKCIEKLTITMGAPFGLHFPRKPKNTFKLDEADEDWNIALPANALNPFAHLLEEQQAKALQSELMNTLAERLLNDDDNKDNESDDGVSGAGVISPLASADHHNLQLKEWELLLAPADGSSSSSPAQKILSVPEMAPIVISDDDDDNNNNKNNHNPSPMLAEHSGGVGGRRNEAVASDHPEEINSQQHQHQVQKGKRKARD